MKKRIFWKDIQKSFSSSVGRFLSIMLLLLLGAFALTGLKVTTPDLQRTASHYLSTHKTMDLSVIATAGLSKDDQKELRQLKGQLSSLITLQMQPSRIQIKRFVSFRTVRNFQLINLFQVISLRKVMNWLLLLRKKVIIKLATLLLLLREKKLI